MDLAGFLITLGVLFLAGLAADEFGRVTRFPRVTLLLLLGLAAGNAGLGLIPEGVAAWFDALSIIALTMVSFLLGGSISHGNLMRHGRAILAISLAIVAFTILLVTAGLTAVGMDPGLALLLGAVATATAPAAMTDVIRQSGVENGFTDTLKAIVAIDDAWGLIVFSVALVLAGHSDGWMGVLSGTFHELGGAVALGIGIGIPAAFLTGRLKPGEPMQAEAIGIVFLTAGIALWSEVSFLIAGMTAGAIIANFARHHDRAFHEIEHIQWPFMILFFLLAGASLEFDALRMLGLTGAMFVVLRILGRLAGGIVGARLGGAPCNEVLWYGPALLPQAGVAVGMALVAGERFPQWETAIMAYTITSTVIFEILGPPVTLLAIRRVSRKPSGHP
ncbi:cation:proton antiporter [Phaeobacter gallaeciensis]|uniref:Cation:proton antiporter n=2 Tax=Roseobacteraceae TaxID=2854170 RepID=A0A366WWC5_9RHOB|nr:MULTISPECIES: cation:proton antiporter [Roseobacteraceae]MBT3141248.1 cation:proton antiporter [Falsiruegeria litorea]MBT8170753.1 cation:proton antiporter [Falsiruegeria litorea]RBW54439.1 cation:proton antiporter [Phaeobacter gallaeciensis]